MISKTDILWILGLGMEYDMRDKHHSLSDLADKVRGVLRAKYKPLVWEDVPYDFSKAKFYDTDGTTEIPRPLWISDASLERIYADDLSIF
jgi:hypothetical protein